MREAVGVAPGVNDPRRFGRRQSALDDVFPLLVGLGFGLVLAVAPWLPQPKLIFVSGLALLMVVPIATLRIRDGRLVWLGPWHAVAASLTVGLDVSFMIVAVVIMPGSPFLLDLPSVLATPSMIVVIALASLFASWLALQLQRWAEATRGAIRIRKSRWDPRAWGPVGVIGGTIFLLAAPTLAAIMIFFSGLPGLGPTRIFYFYDGLIAVALMIAGLACLVAEVRGVGQSAR